MKAIVYTSNTGFTARYAQLLGEKSGLPVYSLQEAQKCLAPQTKILYLGWLRAGQIQGLPQAEKLYQVQILCGVGLRPATEAQPQEMQSRYKELYPQLFYFQGGLAMERLHGLRKIIMKTVCKALRQQLEKKAELTPADRDTLLLLKQGGDRVDPAALEQVLDYIRLIQER